MSLSSGLATRSPAPAGMRRSLAASARAATPTPSGDRPSGTRACGVSDVSLPIVDGQINGRGQSLAEWRTWLQETLASRAGFTVPSLDQIADTPPLLARVN